MALVTLQVVPCYPYSAVVLVESGLRKLYCCTWPEVRSLVLQWVFSSAGRLKACVVCVVTGRSLSRTKIRCQLCRERIECIRFKQSLEEKCNCQAISVLYVVR